MLLLALLSSSPALAQDYAFPTTPEDYDSFYPTAYKDHGGSTDWACGGITYSGHQGSDFGGGSFTGMDEGRDIAAAAPGMVVATNDGEYDRCTSGECEGGGGYGNYVWIQHADGKSTLYAHLMQWSVAVAEGDFVACGELLGQMGSSGYSTGPHLHFGVYATDGSFHDPFWGDCSAPPSYWVDQGDYDALPSLDCDEPDACEPTDALSCGDVVEGRNDAPASTTVHAFYGCQDLIYTGPELVYAVATDRDEPVTITLTGLSADLDLYVLEGDACDESTTDDEAVTFDAEDGHVYTVVVDGWEDAVSPFVLTVACDGAWPDEGDSASPRDTDGGGEGSGEGGEGGEGGAPAEGKGERVPGGGCGCGGGGGAGWWLAALAVARRYSRLTMTSRTTGASATTSGFEDA